MLQGHQKSTFCANYYGKHNPKQDVIIYLKSIFFIEKFTYTNIQRSEHFFYQELHNLVRRIKDCTIQNYFTSLVC